MHAATGDMTRARPAKRIMLMFAVLIFRGCNTVSAGFWDAWSAPVDCSLTHWGSWEDCVPSGTAGVFEHRRTREIVEPQNDGEPCPTELNLIQTEGCNVTEFLADKFIGQLHSATKSLSTDTRPITDDLHMPDGDIMSFSDAEYAYATSDDELSVSVTLPRQCTELKDRDGNIILAGGDCSRTRRQKRSTMPIKRVPPNIRNRDILFLLDESASVNSKHFEIEKKIAAATTSKLCMTARVAYDRTRIAVATFDRQNHPHLYFNNDHMDEPAQLAEKIRRIPYNSRTHGSTRLGAALTYVETHMFTTARGARIDRDRYVQLVVLITDGCANGDGDLSSIAQRLYDSNISILAIKIGTDKACNARARELSNDSMCWQYWNFKTWNDAEEFANAIRAKESCMATFAGFGKTCN